MTIIMRCSRVLYSLLILLVVFISFNSKLYASADYIWDGSVSSNWVTNGNWDRNPGSQNGQQIYIVEGPTTYTNAPVISSTPSFSRGIDGIVVSEGGVLTMNSGTVTVDAEFAVIGGGTFIMNGGTLNISGDMGIYDNGSSMTFNGGTVNIDGDFVLGRDNADFPDGASGQTTITIAGATFNCGDLVFDDNTGDTHQLIISGGGLYTDGDVRSAGEDVNITISGGGVLDIDGDLDMTGGNDNLTMTNGSLFLTGDWDNDGTTTLSGGEIEFIGSSNQSISNSNGGETFYNLTIDNSSGNVSLNDSIIITNRLDLTDGLIIGNGNSVTIVDNATVINASSSSYVDGDINKIGNEAFSFPTGDGAFYNPIGISAPSSATDMFRAQYFRGDPQRLLGLLFSLIDAVVRISDAESWEVDRLVGTSSVAITLNYNTLGDYTGSIGVADLSDLRVARYDDGDTEWHDEGNASTTGNTTLGTVTSPPLSAFSPFTLGFVTYPLPVELMEFNLRAIGNQARIEWGTSSEINNNHFILQRTLDGKNIIDISTIPSKAEGGNSTESIQYAYTDLIDYTDVAYYRLIQVDHDGTSKTYPFEALKVSPSLSLQSKEAKVYPNPVEDGVFRLEIAHEGELDFRFISMEGKIHRLKAIKLGSQSYGLEIMDQVDKGIYLLSIFDRTSGKQLSTQRVLIK